MAYYKKQEILEFIETSFKSIQENRHKSITDPKKAIKELTDENELVGFFWIEFSPNGENSLGIKMEGKVFVRLDSEVYTDDRYALDSYHAIKEGLTILEIIKKREDEKNNAKQNISPEAMEGLKEFLTNPSNV